MRWLGDLLSICTRSGRAELFARLKAWYHDDGRYFVVSMLAHMVGIQVVGLLLLPVLVSSYRGQTEAPEFDAAEVNIPPAADITRFVAGDTPEDPNGLELNPDMLLAPQAAQTAVYYDENAIFQERGGGTRNEVKNNLHLGAGGFNVRGQGLGPMIGGAPGGVGAGAGDGIHWGNGGSGEGFGGRGQGHREAMLGRFGGTKAGERAVAAAINWLARHQNSNGSWSLDRFSRHCTSSGRPCSGASTSKSDTAATALAILPFLACGQTHTAKGPYRENVRKALFWLMKQQNSDGGLAATGEQQMYSHGLATIALCEAYGMTRDSQIAPSASAAVAFIEKAQNTNIGCWRYDAHAISGDTSVFGWQVMALKSAQMAGLAIDTSLLENTQKWLKSVAKGRYGGLYAYQPEREATPTMTAVGLLCRQYLGARRDDPIMDEGVECFLANPPDSYNHRDIYYWYYATQVMFNLGGPNWDRWNRQTRRTLIDTQCKYGCALGSWDPEEPSLDSWGAKGGRLMMTSLGALTLEIYYRYLPLYQLAPKEPSAKPAAVPEVPVVKGEEAPAPGTASSVWVGH